MTVILLRHGRLTSNTAQTLAGRSDGVDLDEKGQEQARRWSTGSGRCRSARGAVATAALQEHRRTVGRRARPEPIVDERISEVDYGQWTGRKIGDRQGAVVGGGAAAAQRRGLPGGEGLAHVQARAVEAVREHDRRLAEEHGGDVLWVACTHGDVIKAIVADALGTHLDSFQRITADTASMSVIRYTTLRPFVVHHTGDQLASSLTLKPPETSDSEAKDAAERRGVGGSTD